MLRSNKAFQDYSQDGIQASDVGRVMTDDSSVLLGSLESEAETL